MTHRPTRWRRFSVVTGLVLPRGMVESDEPAAAAADREAEEEVGFG